MKNNFCFVCFVAVGGFMLVFVCWPKPASALLQSGTGLNQTSSQIIADTKPSPDETPSKTSPKTEPAKPADNANDPYSFGYKTTNRASTTLSNAGSSQGNIGGGALPSHYHSLGNANAGNSPSPAPAPTPGTN